MQKIEFTLVSNQNHLFQRDFIEKNYKISESWLCVIDVYNDLIDNDLALSTKLLGRLLKKVFPQVKTKKMVIYNSKNKKTTSMFYSLSKISQ